MADREVATMRFVDDASGGEALLILRTTEGKIGLALSLGDADIEIFLSPTEAKKLGKHFEKAAQSA